MTRTYAPQPPELEDELTAMCIPPDWEPNAETSRQIGLFDANSLSTLSEPDRQNLVRACLGNLRQTYRELQSQATRVRERVMADRLQGEPAMMARPQADDNDPARALALAAINDWFYHDGQDEKETTVYVGAIACTASTLGALAELNRLKTQFSEGMAAVRTLIEDEPTTAELAKVVSALTPNAPANLRRKAVGELVRQLIHPRLNIRQLVRHAPVLTVCPDRIRWRWTQTPSSMKISRSALIEVLEARTDIDARYDLEAVARCHDPEFSWRKGVSEDCRVSILCKSAVAYLEDRSQPQGVVVQIDDTESVLRLTRNVGVKSRLPVFYLGQAHAPYLPIPKKARKPEKAVRPQLVLTSEDAERRQREGLTEKAPFLRSLAVHRYKKYVTPHEHTETRTINPEPGVSTQTDTWASGFTL